MRRLRDLLGRTPRVAWILAGLALVVRLAWFAVNGVRIAPDTSFYLEAGRSVLAQGYLGPPFFSGNKVFYTGMGYFVAPFVALFGEQAPTAWVGAQILAVSLATVPLYLLARGIAGPRTALLAGLVHVGLYESVQWDIYALSDPIYQAALILVAFLVYRAWREPSTKLRGVAGLGCLGLFFIRPPAIAGVAALLAWMLAVGPDLEFDRRRVVAGTAAAVVFGVGFLVLSGVGDTLIRHLLTATRTVTEFYAEGTVVVNDPSFTVRYTLDPYEEGNLASYIAANPVAYAWITLRRLGALWTVFLHRYSTGHLVVNVVTLLPLFVLGFAGMILAVARARQREGLLLPVLLILAVTYFHAVTLVDWDFRYRYPVLPFMGILAAWTVVTLLDRAWTGLPLRSRRMLARLRLDPGTRDSPPSTHAGKT